MARMVHVVSIPRTGTRFFLYFVRHVLKLPVDFCHFFAHKTDRIEQLIEGDDVLIHPVRPDGDTFESMNRYVAKAGRPSKLAIRFANEYQPLRDHYMPMLVERGVHLMNTYKNENTNWEFDRLLEDIGVPWTPEVTEFIEKWEKVGSQDIGDVPCPKSELVLSEYRQ